MHEPVTLESWQKSWDEAQNKLYFYAKKRLRGVMLAAQGNVPPMSDVNELISQAWIYVMDRGAPYDPTQQTPFSFWRRAIDHAASNQRRKAQREWRNSPTVPQSGEGRPDILDTLHNHGPPPDNADPVEDFIEYLKTGKDATLPVMTRMMFYEGHGTRILALRFKKSESWVRGKKQVIKKMLIEYLKIN